MPKSSQRTIALSLMTDVPLYSSWWVIRSGVSILFQALHFGYCRLWRGAVMLSLVILGLCYLTYSRCQAQPWPGPCSPPVPQNCRIQCVDLSAQVHATPSAQPWLDW